MEGIRIPIGAPLQQLDSDLKSAQSKLSSFAKDAARTSGVLGGSVAKGANQAGFALQNLSRVAQDAPFGFIGIQNNLNPLLESFQRLKAETGSTGSALKALGGSLLGAGGLGFALSAISAGVLLYQQYQQKANKTTENAKKTTEDYANSLGQVARASLLGAQSAAQETTTLSLLYKQYTNGKLSLDQRKSAYDQLQKLYPAYFGNIKFEQEASVKTKDAYDRLTTSILATARARAAADLITKNSQRQLENEQKLIDLGIAGEKTRAKVKKTSQALKGAGATGELGEAKAMANFTSALREQSIIQKQINDIVTDSVKLRDKNLQLEKSVTAEIQKGGLLSGGVGGGAGKAIQEEKNKFIALINDFKGIAKNSKKEVAKSLIEGGPLIDLPKIMIGSSGTYADFGKQLFTPFQILRDEISSNLLPQIGTNFKTFFDDLLMNGKLSFKTLGDSIKNTFASVLASEATNGLLSLLGSTGGVAGKKGGGGLFKVLGGVLGLGGALGGGGAGAAAAGTAATGGALLPILAGVAAVAGIASLFKKKKPATAMPMNIASSASVAQSSDSFGGRVVFEISGTNLIGVLNRSGAKLQRFGP